MGPNCPFATKHIFGQNWLLLLSTYCILSRCNISKNSSKSKSWERRLHTFGPNWVRVTSQKSYFLGKVDQHYFGLTIVSHHAMSFQKYHHRANHENKVAWFLPELPLVQKGNFLENWIIWLMSNYYTIWC